MFMKLDKAMASELQMRSDLMLVLRGIIEAKQWSQSEAAEHLGLTQPRVSYLVNGKVEKFSIDKLLNCLYLMGYRLKPVFTNNSLTVTVESVKTNV